MTAGGAGRPTENRAAKVVRAQALRAEGLLIREVAAEMGATYSTVSSYLCDPDLSKHRARLASYGGTCVDCGEATFAEQKGAASERCASCQHVYQASDEWRARITLWPRERIIEAIHWWNDTYGEPPAMTDWNPWNAERIFHDSERAERGKRLIEAGRVPWFTLAVNRFGSWNAAIEAAGFEPRQGDGGGGNNLHQRFGPVQAGILDALYQSNGQGVRRRELLTLVDAGPHSITNALTALVRQGHVDRIGYGRYRARAAA